MSTSTSPDPPSTLHAASATTALGHGPAASDDHAVRGTAADDSDGLAPWYTPDVLITLGLVYLLWSTTYLGMKFGLRAFPPFFLTGGRCVGAGVLLYCWLRVVRGHKRPAWSAWWKASIVGTLLVGGGTGGICFSLQYVTTGTAAVMIGAVPLWATLFAVLLSGYRPARLEIAGIGLGIVGVAILVGGVGGEPIGIIAMLAAAMSWAFGSMLGRRLSIAPGLMPVAIKLMMGGSALTIVSALVGEAAIKTPGWVEWGAFFYLMLFGMLVGFSSYIHLLRRTKPALATSYAFVNPVLATLLGWWLLDETITLRLALSGAIIVGAVVLIAVSKNRAEVPIEEVAPAEVDVPTSLTPEAAQR